MPAISYTDFSGGLDRRLPISAQDASRLWVLKNAYITTGKRIRKRPGLLKVAVGMFVLQVLYLLRKWWREETEWGLKLKKLLRRTQPAALDDKE